MASKHEGFYTIEDCLYVLWVGRKCLSKKKCFEDYLQSTFLSEGALDGKNSSNLSKDMLLEFSGGIKRDVRLCTDDEADLLNYKIIKSPIYA